VHKIQQISVPQKSQLRGKFVVGSPKIYADGQEILNLTAQNSEIIWLYAQWQAVVLEGGNAGQSGLETQIVDEALTAEHLKALPEELRTIEAIEAVMRDVAVEEGFILTPEAANCRLLDVRLQYRKEGSSGAWTDATADHFPESGIPVSLELPAGANPDRSYCMVVHMFTVDSERLDIKAGDVETFTPQLQDGKLHVTLNGLSPVAILWQDQPVGIDDLPKTGDASMLGAWVCLLGAAGMGLKMKKKS